MGNNIITKGIVLKQSNYGEADRMLTVFTAEYGIIKVAARGVRRMKSRRSAAAQFLCYSDFELFMSNSEVATANNITVLDAFYPAQEEIEVLSLFTYISDLVIAGMGYSNPDERVLKLFLNTLYMCAYKRFNLSMAKTVFELRFMAYMGYVPMLAHCIVCGGQDNISHFDINGGVVCRGCTGQAGKCIDMPEDVYRAICYILASEDKKMFSFKASEEVIRGVSRISEKYIETHLDKNFSSLEYFKKMLT